MTDAQLWLAFTAGEIHGTLIKVLWLLNRIDENH